MRPVESKGHILMMRLEGKKSQAQVSLLALGSIRIGSHLCLYAWVEWKCHSSRNQATNSIPSCRPERLACTSKRWPSTSTGFPSPELGRLPTYATPHLDARSSAGNCKHPAYTPLAGNNFTGSNNTYAVGGPTSC